MKALLLFISLLAGLNSFATCDTVNTVSATSVSYATATINFITPNAHTNYVIVYNGHRQNVNDPGGPYPHAVSAGLTGLTPSTLYTYYIVANCAGPPDSALTSNYTFTTTSPTCDSVTGITTSVTNSTATIISTEAAYGSTYTIFYVKQGFTDTLSVSQGTADFILQTLKNSTVYAFRIRTNCTTYSDSTTTAIHFFTTANSPNYTRMDNFGYQYRRLASDSTLSIPTGSGLPTLRNGKNDKAAIAYDSTNAKGYFFNPKTQSFIQIAAGTDTTAIVESISEMQAFALSKKIIFNRDSLRGGRFNLIYDTTRADDNGVYFAATGIGSGWHWARDISQSKGYHAEWFGAKGDNSTDNTAIVNAAISYVSSVGGGLLNFGKGTFKGNFTMKSQVSIVGVNTNQTVFKSYTDAPIFKMDSTGGSFVTMKDLKVLGDTTRHNENGIDFSTVTSGATNRFTIDNVQVTNCGGVGLYMYGTGTAVGSPHCQGFSVRGSWFFNCRLAAVRIEGSNLENSFFDCFINASGRDTSAANLEILRGPGSLNYPLRTKFIGCVVNGTQTVNGAIHVTGCENLLFEGCDFEKGNPTFDITGNGIDQVKNISIKNCTFYMFASGTYTNAIQYDMVNGLRIENNSFHMAGNSSLVSVLKSNATATNERKVIVTDDNTIQIESGSSITKPWDFNNLGVNIDSATHSINTYNQFTYVGSSHARDTLRYIYDADDSTKRFKNGQILILAVRVANKNILVQSDSGNIKMTNGDFMMNRQSSTLTLVWDGLNGFWRQIGRDESIDSITASAMLNQFYGNVLNVDTTARRGGTYYVNSATRGTLPGSWGTAIGSMQLLTTAPDNYFIAGTYDATEILSRVNTNVIYYRNNPRSTGTWSAWDSVIKKTNFDATLPLVYSTSGANANYSIKGLSALGTANQIPGMQSTAANGLEWKTLTAGTGISITHGTGAITIARSTIDLTTDVTGTLPVGNGGTGQTSYTNGQLLIGNTTGNTLNKATLTAGSGISITNGAGSITIASTSASVPAIASVTGSDVTTTNATATDVTGLTIPVAANTKYRVTVVLYIGCNNTGGVKFGISGPSGTTITSGVWAGSSTTVNGAQVTRSANLNALTGTAFIRANLSTASATFTGYISTSSTTGNITIQFASANAGETSTIFIGSSFDLTIVQ